MLSLTEVFASLGAPLANQRWSWGAQRPSDGTVFLRVWQDETERIDGRLYVQVAAHQFFRGDPDNLGYVERLKHLALAQSGHPVFLIMCVVADTTAVPRTIKRFNAKELFKGGSVVPHNGDEWMEVLDRTSIKALRPNKALERSRER